jgi:hypothetical protein
MIQQLSDGPGCSLQEQGSSLGLCAGLGAWTSMDSPWCFSASFRGALLSWMAPLLCAPQLIAPSPARTSNPGQRGQGSHTCHSHLLLCPQLVVSGCS